MIVLVSKGLTNEIRIIVIGNNAKGKILSRKYMNKEHI